MNREIKFRAYDKERKKIKFFDLKEIYADCYHNVGFLKNAPHEHENDGWEQFELMQFTGIHDKNGKEIFENDIVCWTFNEKQKNEIVFYEGCFGNFNIMGINKEYREFIPICKIRAEHMIVIGNIYQDPELLTEK